MSKTTVSAVVESISLKSVVVSVAGKAVSLTGPVVEAVAGTLKLGDKVEYIGEGEATYFGKTKKTTTPAPAARASSPPAKSVERKTNW